MPNLYVSLDEFKSNPVVHISGTAYDGRLFSLIENISRQVDRHINRPVFTVTETRYFDGDGSRELFTGDLVALTSLKEDSNHDGTYDKTWATADYNLLPYNALPTADWGEPYRSVKVSTSTGTADVFETGEKNYELIGTWGYRQTSEDSGLNGTVADGTATSLVLDGSASGTIEAGQTLFIESDKVFVSQQVISGTAVTVERSINGSTGTAHTNKDVNIITYPGPVVEAVIIQVTRIWKRRESGFASEVGFPETGQMMVYRGGLDPDVKEMLSGYRRLIV